MLVRVGRSQKLVELLTRSAQLNIHQAVQPTYGGFASIFATTFVKPDAPIPMRELKAHARTTTTLGTVETGTTLQATSERGDVGGWV